jgi:hypothetical protein
VLDKNAPFRLDGAHKSALEGCTRSIVSVPKQPTDNGSVVGVLQAINSGRGEISEEDQGRLRSLAAAVVRLLQDGARNRTDASSAGVAGSIAREAHEACALA